MTSVFLSLPALSSPASLNWLYLLPLQALPTSLQPHWHSAASWVLLGYSHIRTSALASPSAWNPLPVELGMAHSFMLYVFWLKRCSPETPLLITLFKQAPPSSSNNLYLLNLIIFFFITLITTWHYIIYLFVYWFLICFSHCSVAPLEQIILSCSLLHPQHQDYCLAHHRQYVFIKWMKE